MHVMLIVKSETISEAIKHVYNHLPEFQATSLSNVPVYQLRLGACRVEVELLKTDAVYRWFNEAASEAPYSEGTLLFFTITT